MKYIKLTVSCHSEQSRELSNVGIDMNYDDPDSIEWREAAVFISHIVDIVPSSKAGIVVITTTLDVLNAEGTLESVLELINKA